MSLVPPLPSIPSHRRDAKRDNRINVTIGYTIYRCGASFFPPVWYSLGKALRRNGRALASNHSIFCRSLASPQLGDVRLLRGSRAFAVARFAAGGQDRPSWRAQRRAKDPLHKQQGGTSNAGVSSQMRQIVCAPLPANRGWWHVQGHDRRCSATMERLKVWLGAESLFALYRSEIRLRVTRRLQ